jgi:hypothetical protein
MEVVEPIAHDSDFTLNSAGFRYGAVFRKLTSIPAPRKQEDVHVGDSILELVGKPIKEWESGHSHKLIAEGIKCLPFFPANRV